MNSKYYFCQFYENLANPACSKVVPVFYLIQNLSQSTIREYLRGKYHCTIDLLFDWFGISCMTTEIFCFYLQNRLIQLVKQEVNGTVIRPPFVFPATMIYFDLYDYTMHALPP